MNNTKDLYDVTLTQAVEDIVKNIMERYGCTKSEAKLLLNNALLYNVVRDEIIGQIDYLLNRSE